MNNRCVVKGTLLTPTGVPVKFGSFFTIRTIYDPSGEGPYCTVEIDSDGSYEFELIEGTYRIEFSSPSLVLSYDHVMMGIVKISPDKFVGARTIEDLLKNE